MTILANSAMRFEESRCGGWRILCNFGGGAQTGCDAGYQRRRLGLLTANGYMGVENAWQMASCATERGGRRKRCFHRHPVVGDRRWMIARMIPVRWR
ncbi:hypothetical protein KCP78_21655 [Salmonella enterica subsp. enterica]|nr:hypothetical protein KCP78_21655 [Salmonella enterica subsp. enterica]